MTYYKTAYEQLKACDPELYQELLNWVRFGKCKIGLLSASLHNDFEKVMCYRNHEDMDTLIALAKTIYNYVPSMAWKTPDCIKLWKTRREISPLPEFEFGSML